MATKAAPKYRIVTTYLLTDDEVELKAVDEVTMDVVAKSLQTVANAMKEGHDAPQIIYIERTE